MILTNRDKAILKFMEKYGGSITINQCAKIFFNNCKESYYQARKRLKKLSDNGYLKRYRQDMRAETVYFLEKKLSYHNLKVIDIYAFLISVGADIRTFEREYTIGLQDKEYRCDGFIEYVKDDYLCVLLCEIDYSHFTSTKKLMDIYSSNYFQNKYKDMGEDIFPMVLIARPVVPSTNTDNLPFNVTYVDLSLCGVEKILDY